MNRPFSMIPYYYGVPRYLPIWIVDATIVRFPDNPVQQQAITEARDALEPLDIAFYSIDEARCHLQLTPTILPLQICWLAGWLAG